MGLAYSVVGCLCVLSGHFTGLRGRFVLASFRAGFLRVPLVDLEARTCGWAVVKNCQISDKVECKKHTNKTLALFLTFAKHSQLLEFQANS